MKTNKIFNITCCTSDCTQAEKGSEGKKSNMKENSDQKKVIKVIAWGEPTVGACYSITLGSNGAEENL